MERVRSSRWAVAAVVAALGLGAFGLTAVLLNRQVPTAQSPTPSGEGRVSASSAPASQSASARPSESPEPTPSVPAASPVAPAGRTEWSRVVVAPAGSQARLIGVYQTPQGSLLGHGMVGADGVPAFWSSPDGQTWSEPVQVPPLPDGLCGGIVDVLWVDDHYVAVAALDGCGTESYANSMFTSPDGSSWTPVDDTPGVEAAVLHRLIRTGDVLLAVGDGGVWRSEDAGASWTEATSAEDLAGRIQDVELVEGRLVAAGWEGEMFGPKIPVAWTSDDHGMTWHRAALAEADGAAGSLAIGADGTVIAMGTLGEPQRTVVWRSDDAGSTWTLHDAGACCGSSVVATPTGFAATVSSAIAGTVPGVISSVDGIAWSEVDPLADLAALRRLSWTPSYGLVLAAETDPSADVAPVPGDVVFVLAPHPYP